MASYYTMAEASRLLAGPGLDQRQVVARLQNLIGRPQRNADGCLFQGELRTPGEAVTVFSFDEVAKAAILSALIETGIRDRAVLATAYEALSTYSDDTGKTAIESAIAATMHDRVSMFFVSVFKSEKTGDRKIQCDVRRADDASRDPYLTPTPKGHTPQSETVVHVLWVLRPVLEAASAREVDDG